VFIDNRATTPLFAIHFIVVVTAIVAAIVAVIVAVIVFAIVAVIAAVIVAAVVVAVTITARHEMARYPTKRAVASRQFTSEDVEAAKQTLALST